MLLYRITNFSNQASTGQVYYVFSKRSIDQGILRKIASNPLTDTCYIDELQNHPKHNSFDMEILYRKGMTDNVATSFRQALEISLEIKDVELHSGRIYRFPKDTGLSEEELLNRLEKKEFNPLIHEVFFQDKQTIEKPQIWDRLENYKPKMEVLDFDKDWHSWSTKRGMGLSSKECESIRDHFKKLSREPTDVELEVLAQTWSEHCKHKIFAAEIDYKEKESAPQKIGEKRISSLFKSFIQSTVKPHHKHCISVFHDNAGVVRWSEDIDLCIKVETHNSPSALDPYSGAITGILGVQRDIMGTGKGARPIANLDVFCIGNEEDFPEEDSSERPEGLFRPDEILEGVHKGVQEGGNHMGVPTINGSFQVHPSFSGKPLIYVGSLGFMPAGRDLEKKEVKSGDLIFVGGGRLGKDGIHGATFSSQNWEGPVASTVVQIGDPITQKRLLDFTLKARDLGLISGLTDNGAGGISSSIGEMAELTGGAKIDISKHPKKYEELDYFEMVISESQERMSYAVRPENKEAFESLAIDYGVEVSHLGEFTTSGKFEVYHQEKSLVDLDLKFLHEGYPKLKLSAEWLGPRKESHWYRRTKKSDISSMEEVVKRILESPNVKSKEKWVRQYDLEVGGATSGKPFIGPKQKGPSDQGIIDLRMYGAKKKERVALAHGFSAKTSFIDGYYMALSAMDECLRNLLSAGVDFKNIALVDNFCWPNAMSEDLKKNKSYMADLVRSNFAINEFADIMEIPFVSGKDSMKNTWKGKNKKGDPICIDVEPSLLISGMGYLSENDKSISASFKSKGDLVYLLTFSKLQLLASEYAYYFNTNENPEDIEYPDLKKIKQGYEKLYQVIQKDWIHSCHDISDGGAFVSLFESALSGGLGFTSELKLDENYFKEGMASFLITCPRDKKSDMEDLFGSSLQYLGEVSEEKKMHFSNASFLMKDLEGFWRQQ